MDTAVPMTATQLAIIWPLLGFLLIWMILFAVLAFRPDPAKNSAELTLASNAHAPSPSAMLHLIASQPAPTDTKMPVSPGMVSKPGSDSSNGTGASKQMH